MRCFKACTTGKSFLANCPVTLHCKFKIFVVRTAIVLQVAATCFKLISTSHNMLPQLTTRAVIRVTINAFQLGCNNVASKTLLVLLCPCIIVKPSNLKILIAILPVFGIIPGSSFWFRQKSGVLTQSCFKLRSLESEDLSPAVHHWVWYWPKWNFTAKTKALLREIPPASYAGYEVGCNVSTYIAYYVPRPWWGFLLS